MTREEAKQWILEHMPPDDDTKQSQAMAMAIQALSSWEEYSDKLWKEAYERGKTETLSQEPCKYWQNGKCNGNTEVCEDAVSRDEVFEIICRETEWYDIRTQIEQLPPVTQKSESVTEFADRCRECGAKYGKYRKEAKRWKNKWLKSQKSGKWDMSCTCSVCGNWRILESEKNGGKYKYCPNCGAKMVEPQESEVRNDT